MCINLNKSGTLKLCYSKLLKVFAFTETGFTVVKLGPLASNISTFVYSGKGVGICTLKFLDYKVSLLSFVSLL